MVAVGIGHFQTAVRKRLAQALGKGSVVLGDDPTAFDNPNFRKLLENALKWVAWPEARS